jgi:hypothetical protein
MKLIKSMILTGAVALGAILVTGATAHAQNPNHTPGDLVLFFQNPGGATGADQQIYASLGNTATVFRQAYTNQTNLINIINIGTLMVNTFGANWASETTLYGGLGGVWGTSGSLSNALENGDPNRTIYTSQARNATGTVGDQGTVGYTLGTDGVMSTLANSITTQNGLLENSTMLQADAIAILPTQLTANVPGQNPVGGNSWNNGIPAPGVQQQGSGGNFGTFGPVANVEFMWDIFRIQAKDSIAGQYGQGDGIRTSLYLGTITLDSAGNVSFIVSGGPVPSPSLTVTGSPAAMTTTQGTASATQTFTVSGTNLTGNVTVTAPTSFEVSTNGTTFGATAVLPPTGGTLAATTVYVRIAASAPVGSPSGNVSVTSPGATTENVPVTGTVNAPAPTLTTVGAPAAMTTTQGTPSAPQTFTVSGTNLTNNVTVGAPTSFEVSPDGTTFGATAVLTPTGGTLAATTVYVRIAASAPAGGPGGDVTVASPGATTRNVAVTGTVNAPDPTLTVVGAPAAMTTTQGTPSAPQTFTVSGANLTGNVTVGAPASFEVSPDGTTFNATAVLTPTGGTLAATTVYVRIAASAPVGNPGGNVSVESPGAGIENVPVTGTVNAPVPTVIVPGTPVAPMSTTEGTTSNAESFTISGANLTDDVTVTAPTDFEVSSDGTTYDATAVLPPTDGTLAATTVYVRIAASAPVGDVGGDVSVTSPGATPQNVPVFGTVSLPPPTLTVDGAPAEMITTQGTASAAQSFTVSGANLTDDVTVTAPASFEVSSDGTIYDATAVLPPTDGTLDATTVYVRIAASAPVGNPGGDVSVATTGATTENVPVSGTVSLPPPTLTVTGTPVAPMNTTEGTASNAETFTVSGANLTGDVTVTAPVNFEVSSDGGTTFGPTAVLTPTDGTLDDTIVGVRIAATAPVGNPGGDVTVESPGATTENVPVVGTVNNPGPPDKTKPRLALDAKPAANSKVTESPLTFSGKCVEKGSTPVVEFRVGEGGAWVPAILTNAANPFTWTASVPLEPGVNKVQFQARDASGNQSPIVSRSVNYIVKGTLTVVAPAPEDGKITKGFEGETQRDVGATYKITATPAKGKIFKEWLKDGASFDRSAVLSFVMEDGMTLEPVFIDDPFPGVAGTFNDLVGEGDLGDGTPAARAAFFQNNGFLTITTTAKGAFSGKLMLEGKSHAIRGKFDGYGEATVTIKRPKMSDAVMNLVLDSVAPGKVDGDVTTGGDPMLFSARPSGFTGKKGSEHPFNKRKFTVLLPGSDPAFGHGFVTLSFLANGSATSIGKLSDGTPTRSSVRSFDDGNGNWDVPAFAQLYKGGTGMLWGDLVLPKVKTEGVPEVEGDAAWLKPEDAKSKIFPEGFLNVIEPVGTGFALTKGISFLSGTADDGAFNLVIDPVPDLLDASILQAGTWPATNLPKLTAPVENKLTLRFTAAAGTVKGTFQRPADPRPVSTTFEGVVFAYPIAIAVGGDPIRGGGFFSTGTACAPFQIGDTP